jgi:hypothetical protein
VDKKRVIQCLSILLVMNGVVLDVMCMREVAQICVWVGDDLVVGGYN